MRTALWIVTALLALLPGIAPAAAPSVSMGQSFALAVTADGTVLAWGDNTTGSLGNGSIGGFKSSPVLVIGLTGAVAVAAGNAHSLAIRNDGTVWAWGWGVSGQLGDGTSTPARGTPGQVQGLTNVIAIAAGNSHSMALRADGTLWTWGGNGVGQLGTGTTTGSTTPIQVMSGVAAISTRWSTSLALKSDGTVWAWGVNTTGQVGDGTSTNRLTPAQILTGARSISMGGDHALALKTDGTAWAWGENFYGQLGDKTTTRRLSPIRMTDVANVSAIAAGYVHTMLLSTSGGVYAWGGNFNGVLGNGGYASVTTPVQIAGLANVAAIVPGESNSLVVLEDGSLRAWGSNASGGIGDGTTAARLTPVTVKDGRGTGTLTIGTAAPIQAVAPVQNVAGRVSVTATASFAPELVGKPIFLFAFAPRSTTLPALEKELAAKDALECVLAQITPAGYTPVTSASGLAAFGTNVLNSISQSLSMITNVLISKVAGSSLCVGVGDNGTEATTPGNFVCPASILDNTGAVCQPGQIDTTSGGGGGGGGGSGKSTKTLGSRATVSAGTTLYGGFELSAATQVYILVRGNSLGTLGITQSFLDLPRVRLYNSAGQDVLYDGNSNPGFNSCTAGGLSSGPVINYYGNVRHQPTHERDACTAQNLAAGAYSFTVTPSSGSSSSTPASGEILFEVTLGGGAGSGTRTLGSRATVSPSVALYGGFELASASTVYILVRGNSLGTLGVTQAFLDGPNVRLYDSMGRELVSGALAGCAAAPAAQAPVFNYYQNTRHQPAHARDSCHATDLPAGVYSFAVSPATQSRPSQGEILFEVTLP